MSKRKPTKASKRAHRSKVAARAHRNKQDLVKSTRDDLQRYAAVESLLQHEDSRQKARIVERQEAPSVEKQKAPIAENRAAIIQDRFGQMRGFDFSLATANMLTSQAMLLEMGTS